MAPEGRYSRVYIAGAEHVCVLQLLFSRVTLLTSFSMFVISFEQHLTTLDVINHFM